MMIKNKKTNIGRTRWFHFVERSFFILFALTLLSNPTLSIANDCGPFEDVLKGALNKLDEAQKAAATLKAQEDARRAAAAAKAQEEAAKRADEVAKGTALVPVEAKPILTAAETVAEDLKLLPAPSDGVKLLPAPADEVKLITGPSSDVKLLPGPRTLAITDARPRAVPLSASQKKTSLEAILKESNQGNQTTLMVSTPNTANPLGVMNARIEGEYLIGKTPSQLPTDVRIKIDDIENIQILRNADQSGTTIRSREAVSFRDPKASSTTRFFDDITKTGTRLAIQSETITKFRALPEKEQVDILSGIAAKLKRGEALTEQEYTANLLINRNRVSSSRVSTSYLPHRDTLYEAYDLHKAGKISEARELIENSKMTPDIKHRALESLQIPKESRALVVVTDSSKALVPVKETLPAVKETLPVVVKEVSPSTSTAIKPHIIEGEILDPVKRAPAKAIRKEGEIIDGDYVRVVDDAPALAKPEVVTETPVLRLTQTTADLPTVTIPKSGRVTAAAADTVRAIVVPSTDEKPIMPVVPPTLQDISVDTPPTEEATPLPTQDTPPEATPTPEPTPEATATPEPEKPAEKEEDSGIKIVAKEITKDKEERNIFEREYEAKLEGEELPKNPEFVWTCEPSYAKDQNICKDGTGVKVKFKTEQYDDYPVKITVKGRSDIPALTLKVRNQNCGLGVECKKPPKEEAEEEEDFFGPYLGPGRTPPARFQPLMLTPPGMYIVPGFN